MKTINGNKSDKYIVGEYNGLSVGVGGKEIALNDGDKLRDARDELMGRLAIEGHIIHHRTSYKSITKEEKRRKKIISEK